MSELSPQPPNPTTSWVVTSTQGRVSSRGKPYTLYAVSCPVCGFTRTGLTVYALRDSRCSRCYPRPDAHVGRKYVPKAERLPPSASTEPDAPPRRHHKATPPYQPGAEVGDWRVLRLLPKYGRKKTGSKPYAVVCRFCGKPRVVFHATIRNQPCRHCGSPLSKGSSALMERVACVLSKRLAADLAPHVTASLSGMSAAEVARLLEEAGLGLRDHPVAPEAPRIQALNDGVPPPPPADTPQYRSFKAMFPDMAAADVESMWADMNPAA